MQDWGLGLVWDILPWVWRKGYIASCHTAALPRAVADVAAEEAGAGAGARGRLLPRLALRQLQVAVRTAGARVPQQPTQLELVQAHLNKMIINLWEKWQDAFKSTTVNNKWENSKHQLQKIKPCLNAIITH